MTRRNPQSRGEDLERRLQQGRLEAEGALAPGARNLPALAGVTQSCRFTQPQENVLLSLGRILVNSARVYRYGSDTVLEVSSGDSDGIAPLTSNGVLTSAAVSRLANVVICEEQPPNADMPPVQFPLPAQVVSLALNSEALLEQLPTIKQYSRTPVFDENLQFRGPGWHADVGILVHGPEVDPEPRCLSHEGDTIDRLPPHLRMVLRDFPFCTPADLTNAVAAMLTIVLLCRYTLSGKPVILADGNQPSLGKSWFIQMLAILLDGVEASPVVFTRDDDELGKRICAVLRSRSTSMVFLDNAKVPSGQQLDSAVLEAATVSPRFSARILQQSVNYERPNDLLWTLTMNNTRASNDLLSRSLCIRFWYDGDPGQRDFGGRNPLEYARVHRAEILGELAGMVVHWTQMGCPPGRARHRLSRWSTEVGGILECNGFEGFLENADEVSGACSTSLDALAALAEAAVALNSSMVVLVD